MKVEAKLRLPKMTRDEALKIYEGFLHEHPDSHRAIVIVAWLREMPKYAKVRVTRDLLTGGFEIKRVDRKRRKRYGKARI